MNVYLLFNVYSSGFHVTGVCKIVLTFFEINDDEENLK